MKRSSFISEIPIIQKENKKLQYDFLELAKSNSSASLLQNMSFNVDISKLYTVVASACTN